MLSFGSLASFILVGCAISARAETHTIEFVNNCGFGTPILEQNGNVLSTGAPFTINGPLIDAIAYLQTVAGNCGLEGQGCTIIVINLINPTSPGTNSNVSISLTPPAAFSVTTGYGFFNGCDGEGADCTNANCPAAETNGIVPVNPPCATDNVNLAITFCD
ncbi:hypothetical protein HYPSUDRAFT_82372 [Hypholoma sublateritium FD-334 SS-4]|uniref:Glycopeptide n=1 Tax=Hypholoma sublateritium (strain FD-334 SS-4) TaxID=945553 RepID=A0A0D2PK84_HYPSF|nr:hypothetical protein HYPSUDRAFT_82372 [Hypholoma sublateritium FD-334 SS-4]